MTVVETPVETGDYGSAVASVYDRWIAARDTDEAVAFLREIVGRGRALELGVGTGRIALELARAGAEVTGVDSSAAMLRVLRTKPDAGLIEIVEGDVATLSLDRTYDLVYAVDNTLFALATQADQLRCLECAATHLAPHGRLVLQCSVPRSILSQASVPLTSTFLDDGSVLLQTGVHDPAEQRIRFRHIRIATDGIAIFPTRLRYALPPELDALAKLAGLRLERRIAGWDGTRFTASATRHVSVYATV
jgi:SAM-dependent methyltransferase